MTNRNPYECGAGSIASRLLSRWNKQVPRVPTRINPYDLSQVAAKYQSGQAIEEEGHRNPYDASITR